MSLIRLIAAIVAVIPFSATAVCPAALPASDPRSFKDAICGSQAQDLTGAELQRDTLYACSGAASTFRPVETCRLGCQTKGRGEPDACVSVARPPLWEHGWALLRLGDATTEGDGVTSLPAEYTQTCGSDATCKTIGGHGLLRGPISSPAGRFVPFSYHNDAGPTGCVGCAPSESCSLTVCVPDYAGVGAGWSGDNAVLLEPGETLEWRLDGGWGDGAYGASIATVIMGEGNIGTGEVGDVVIERLSATGTTEEKRFTLTGGINVRAYAGTPNTAPGAVQIASAACRTPGPLAGSTCKLDYQRFDIPVAEQERQIIRIRIEASASLRVHAVSVQPARIEVRSGGVTLPPLAQDDCSVAGGWGKDRYGGRPFSIPCTIDADCDNGDVACVAGKCTIAWGQGRTISPIGSVLTATTMLVNSYASALPGFMPKGGAALIDKAAPHTPRDLNRWLQQDPNGFQGVVTGTGSTALAKQLDYALAVCQPKAGGGVEPKTELAPRADAQAFCNAVHPIALQWRPKILGPTQPLVVGGYVELTPSGCPSGGVDLACGKAKSYFNPTTSCGSAPLPQRPVLMSGGKVPVPIALLEIETTHPFRPASSANCRSVAPKTSGPEKTFMEQFKDMRLPWLDVAQKLPCTPNYVARVVRVLDPTYLIPTEASGTALPRSWAFVEVGTQHVATRLGLEYRSKGVLDFAPNDLRIPFDAVGSTPRLLDNVLKNGSDGDKVIGAIKSVVGQELIVTWTGPSRRPAAGDLLRVVVKGTTLEFGVAADDALAPYPDGYGAALAREVEQSLRVDHQPVLLRVKDNAHTILGVGLESAWLDTPFDLPEVGLRTAPAGGWYGTFVVNDPQLPVSQNPTTLFYGNTRGSGPDRNAFVKATWFSVPSGAPLGGAVVIRTHSPAVPVVTAADGTRAGWLPNGIGAIAETAGSSLEAAEEDVVVDDGGNATVSVPADEPERFRDVVLTNPPAGALKLDLAGTASGRVTVEVIAVDPDGGVHTQTAEFVASLDAVVSFDIVRPVLPGQTLVVTPRAPVDLDLDGVFPPADCNDQNLNVNPRRLEVCTGGLDEDCDGFTDDNDRECSAPLACPDADGDEFANCLAKGCDPTGLTCGDCNDAAATVNPGRGENSDAPVICFDDLDNDCDGLVDEEERGCLRLPFPEIGDLCLLDIQCGDVLFCDNFLGGGIPTFTCQARKGGGTPCFKSDVCASGQCGLGQCCDNPDTCPSVELYLGKFLGGVSLEEELPSGCYGGSATVVPPCGNRPFCSFDVEACKDGTNWTNVTIDAIANAGPLGQVAVTGTWDDSGKSCLEGDAPNPTGLPISLKDLHVTICDDGEGGGTIEAEGTTTLSGKPASFTGKIVTAGTSWTLTMHVDSLVLGAFTITDATLMLQNGLPSVGFSGHLAVPASNLALLVSGSYVDAGVMTLDLALEGGPWSPVPGLTFNTLTGSLLRDAAGAWSTSIQVDAVLPVGPLPSVQVAGNLTIDGATGRVSGCLDAKQNVAQGSPTVGVPLTGLKVTVCINEGGNGQVLAKVSGTTTLFGGSTPFTGTLGLGPVWRLSLSVGALALGPFSATSASLDVRGAGSTIKDIKLRAIIQIGTGPSALSLVALGDYKATGAMALGLSLVEGTSWTPAPGLTFYEAGGTLNKSDAGAWSGTVNFDADVALGPFTGMHVAGDLVLGANDVTGCLSASASQSQGDRTLGPIVLEDIRTTLCVNQGVPKKTTATLSGQVDVFGKPSAFAGTVVLGDPWSVSLSLSNLTLGGLTIDFAMFEAEPQGPGVALTLAIGLTLGTGPSALSLVAAGDYVSSGAMTFALGLADGRTWTPVPGFTIAAVGGTLTRAANGALTVALTIDTTLDVGPLVGLRLTGNLNASTATGIVTGCLTTSTAFDATVAGVSLKSLAVQACIGHDGAGPTLTATLTGQAVIFGTTATVTGTIVPAPVKTMTLTVTNLNLPPFTVDTATVTLVTPATGPATATFSGDMTFGTGPGALKLRATGAVGTGNVTLALGLVPGNSWTPAPGLTLATLGGTMTRTGNVWSATAAIDATVGVGPFGNVLLKGNFTLNGATKAISGCVNTLVPTSPTVGGISLSNLTVGVCVQTAADGTVTASGTANGTASVFGANATFTATVTLGTPSVATLEVGTLTLGAFTLTQGRLVLTKAVNGTISATVSGETTLGKGPGALTVVVNGAYAHPGDLNLVIAMKQGTSWTPAPGVTISSAGGTLRRIANVWSAQVSVDANATVGPLGAVRMIGTLDATGGQVFTGCLTLQKATGGVLDTVTLGGVALVELTATACLFSNAAGDTRMTASLTGKAVLQGALGIFAGTIELAPTGWTASLGLENLVLGGFQIPFARLTIVQGASGAPTVTLNGTMVIGSSDTALSLAFAGNYKPTGIFDLALSVPTGTPWRPVAGLTIDQLAGKLAFDGVAYKTDFTVSTNVTLPIFGALNVTGTLSAVVADGPPKVTGCLSGTLPLTALKGLPGASGTATGKVCLGDTGPVITLALGTFTPLKGLSVGAVTGELKFQPPPGGTVSVWQATFKIGPVTWTPIPGFSVTGATAEAKLVEGGSWTVTATGTTSIMAGGLNLSLAITGSLGSDQHIRLSGTLPGDLNPLGGTLFVLKNPTVGLDFDTVANTVKVTIGSTISVSLFGLTLAANVEGGATIGSTSGIFFTGEVVLPDVNKDGVPDPLMLPGFPPITGGLCVGASSVKLDGITFCGKTVTLNPGLTIYALADLPMVIIPAQPKAPLLINIQSLTHLIIEASLDFGWMIVKPADKLPTIDSVTLGALSLFANIDGANIQLGIGASIAFKPTNQVTPVQGKANVTFTPGPPPGFGAELYLKGRWLEPLSLPKIAIQSPGITLGILIPPAVPPVPVPTRFGISGDLFWLKTGNWPTENTDFSEHCGNSTDDDADGKTDCVDTTCANRDLYCVTNVTTIGATLFFDTIPTESGICIGACLPLPQILVRFLLKNFGLADVARILNDVRAGAIGIMNSFSPVIGSALGSVPIPTVNFAPLTATINELSFFISTHNKEVLGTSYGAGLTTKLDLTVNTKKLLLAGSVDKNGLLIQGRVSPMKLFGVDLLGNPFAKIAKLNTGGDISVAHATALEITVGTIEGLVKGGPWSTTALGTGPMPAVLAAKESGSDGYAIGVGEAGVDGFGRVLVRIRKAGAERVIRTERGVIPPSIATHVAVSFEPGATGVTRVVVRVNGEVVTILDPATAKIGPATSGQALILGKGLKELDEVRIWKAPRDGALIAGQARVLPVELMSSADLVARWEFDYDGTTIANNSKVITGATSDTAKLNGAFRTTATTAISPEGQDLFFKLGLLVNGGAENGFVAQSGVNLTLPTGGTLTASSMVQIGADKVEGRVYAKDITLLDLPFFGKLVLGGYGPNGVAGDFDDGLFATFDLLKLTFSGSGRLAQIKPNGTVQVFAQGTAALRCTTPANCTLTSPHVLEASGAVDFTASIPGLGTTGIQGTGSFSTGTQRIDVAGKVIVGSREFASGTVKVTPQKTELTASATLDVLGINLGSVSLALNLDFAASTFCGSGLYAPPAGSPLGGKGSCSVNACFGTNTSVGVSCGGFEFCTSNSNCLNGKVCAIGFCVQPLANGAVCLVKEQCLGGGCLATCYTRFSKKMDDSCILLTLDHCETGLACLPTPSPKCLKLNLGQGLPCFDTLQCASPLQCKTGTTLGKANPFKQCLKTNQPDGTGCANDVECQAQHVCAISLTQGTICACDGDSTCPSGQYCDYSCRAKKSIGTNCGAARECASNACAGSVIGGVCYGRNTKEIGTSCVANDHCVSNYCDFGTCRCDGDSDCTSANHCDNKACVGPVGESAGCESNRWCAGSTPCLNTGDPAKPKACITAGSKTIGQTCMGDIHCASGKCPGTAALGKTCKCDSASDCGSNKWCDRGLVDLGYGDCKNQKSDFSGCSANIECTGDTCGGGVGGAFKECLTPDARDAGQSCVANAHCDGSMKCDGTCYAPDTRNVGQSCVNSDHCKANICLLGTCRCDGNSDCDSDEFCDILGGAVCKSRQNGGVACGIFDDVCKSDKCTWGYCACFGQSGCPSSKYCHANYCKGKKDYDSWCDHDYECDTGDCKSVKTHCFFDNCTYENKCR